MDVGKDDTLAVVEELLRDLLRGLLPLAEDDMFCSLAVSLPFQRCTLSVPLSQGISCKLRAVTPGRKLSCRPFPMLLFLLTGLAVGGGRVGEDSGALSSVLDLFLLVERRTGDMLRVIESD